MFVSMAEGTMAVTLDIAKLHLRVTHNHEDNLIMSYIQAATAAAEHETGRSLITQQWEMHLERFPLGNIHLEKPPVQLVDSISYLDSELNRVTINPDEYRLSWHPIQPRILGAWPQGTNVIVQFTAGYGSESQVPEPIRQWILTQISTMYWNREAISGKNISVVPYVDRLLDRYRIWNVV